MLGSRLVMTDLGARPSGLFRSFLNFVVRGYNRRSFGALVVLVLVGGSVGYRWSDLLDQNGGFDLLLVGIWSGLAALICWRVSTRRDPLLLLVGMAGGACIEWWGTQTQLWTYFTEERPPLWILPAWPLATLGIDRLGSALNHILEHTEQRGRPIEQKYFRWVYHGVLLAFVAWMTHFAWHTVNGTPTRVAVVAMLGVTLHAPRPRQDLLLLLGGTFMGLFLEYWGTSRECWTYYTHQVPPPVAVVAHGFAAVSFARVTGWLEATLFSPQGTLRPSNESTS